MPRVLSDSDVADFRTRLCAAAEELFAEQGIEAVTMRQLAERRQAAGRAAKPARGRKGISKVSAQSPRGGRGAGG